MIVNGMSWSSSTSPANSGRAAAVAPLSGTIPPSGSGAARLADGVPDSTKVARAQNSHAPVLAFDMAVSPFAYGKGSQLAVMSLMERIVSIS